MDINEKRFYIDFNYMTMVYPCEISRRITNFGVLGQYKDKKYTLKEINKIIAELIIKMPFISNSMSIHICIKNGAGYHYILDIQNYNYNNQERTDEMEIKFLY